jgi:hypothetical protein
MTEKLLLGVSKRYEVRVIVFYGKNCYQQLAILDLTTIPLLLSRNKIKSSSKSIATSRDLIDKLKFIVMNSVMPIFLP